MMPLRLAFPPPLDADAFLEGYWQRRPLLMRDAFPGFRSPLSADELAGLACEPGVESRLVLEHGATPWEVRHGPFDGDDFATLPETHWTLLVQDVDKHLGVVAELLDAFDFLPEWRLDDIMISFAADQGSVGPHTDEYDVFLIQAEGRRRWRIDTRLETEPALIPGLDLRILERFEAREQWVLEPGDCLYLPPGVPHWGIAEGPCMTWSVGLRAPAWRELGTLWSDRLLERHLPAGRYGDPGLARQAHRGEIPPETARVLRERILDALRDAYRDADEDGFLAWLGTHLSESKENLEAVPAEHPESPDSLREAILTAGGLERGPSRILFARPGADRLLLFAGGEAHALPADRLGFAALLSGSRRLPSERLARWLDDPPCLALLTELYNQGHYVLPD